MNVYITSDQHFLHQNIIRYCNRPFSMDLDGVIENAKLMYDRYNATVKEDDVVLFLGDLAFLNSKNREVFAEMFKTMPGHKILIRGNHDSQTDEYYKSIGFEVVTDHIILGRYMLCHYPLFKDAKFQFSSLEKHLKDLFVHFKCDTIIHGHIHEKDSPTGDKVHRLNVCVDYNNFNLVKFNKRIFVTFFKNYLKKLESNCDLSEDSEYSFKYSTEKLQNITVRYPNLKDIPQVTRTKKEGRSERYVA